ncbi:MAG TPA: MFS transporter [Vicinamibacterales bacterium]|nr:MFS transporter [Vicinamibacterales bacterium]
MLFWREATPTARRALIAASLGWMLDAFDVMLYALVLTSLRSDLAIDAKTAGGLQSLTLLASAAGGVMFGILADRQGRVRALMLSVLLYSVFTAACGLAQTAAQLAVFRIFLGLGMGGEWASGAALVSETWSDRHRGKALGLMQSSWAIGYALAAVVNLLVQDVLGFGWRAVFFVGVVPALYAFWVRRRVEEPALWKQARARPARVSLREAIAGPMLRVTVAVTLMNACTMFAWWGFNTWVPSYLRLAPSAGGIGLSGAAMNFFIIAMQVGMWFGYVTFGFVADHVGRKRTYVTYLVLAAVFVLLYASTGNPTALFALGPVTAFFATGFFSGFGAVTAELFPTEVRATAQGFTYNIGRVASAAAPYVVGGLTESRGFPAALSVAAAAYALAAVFWVAIPETKGREIK